MEEQHLRLATRLECEVSSAVRGVIQLPLGSDEAPPGQHVEVDLPPASAELQEIGKDGDWRTLGRFARS